MIIRMHASWLFAQFIASCSQVHSSTLFYSGKGFRYNANDENYAHNSDHKDVQKCRAFSLSWHLITIMLHFLFLFPLFTEIFCWPCSLWNPFCILLITKEKLTKKTLTTPMFHKVVRAEKNFIETPPQNHHTSLAASRQPNQSPNPPFCYPFLFLPYHSFGAKFTTQFIRVCQKDTLALPSICADLQYIKLGREKNSRTCTNTPTVSLVLCTTCYRGGGAFPWFLRSDLLVEANKLTRAYAYICLSTNCNRGLCQRAFHSFLWFICASTAIQNPSPFTFSEKKKNNTKSQYVFVWVQLLLLCEREWKK